MIESPKSLGNPQHRAERLAQIHNPHISELTAFVDRMRSERRWVAPAELCVRYKNI